MSTAGDALTAFVDTLAATLDDHQDGSAIAARLHLSRYHLDRLISAAAGEPPARLRRRILLERAAYRLLSSDRTVLEVAVEADYSSHEAFTRAFQRAYGVAPTRWRAEPRQIQLPSASHVHFHPPAGLRLPSRNEVTPMQLLTKLVEHHVWLVGEIVDRLDRLDDSRLDTLIRVSCDNEDGTMSLRSITSRLIGQMDMWICAIENREYDWELEKHEPVSSMHRRLDHVGPAFLAHVREVVDTGRLDDTFIDALCDPPEVFTYGGMIAHVLT
ncbi:MAG TPA: AraC family transcriptional regulator, partial [Candidatus Angelobacter sp.]|nr:AraC family transcriptional regulator [Candidatus Angelobacter sp.]